MNVENFWFLMVALPYTMHVLTVAMTFSVSQLDTVTQHVKCTTG